MTREGCVEREREREREIEREREREGGREGERERGREREREKEKERETKGSKRAYPLGPRIKSKMSRDFILLPIRCSST